MRRDDADRLDERTVVLVSVAKRQWERTFDAISEPLMILDDDFVVRRANLALADDLGVAVQRLAGRTCHEVRGESVHRFERGANGRCLGCPVEEARRSGAPQDNELRAESGRVYRLRAYPLDDEAGQMMVCRYRDVSAEKEMLARLAQTEKLAAIGRLAGGVAHEINNPLGGILAFTQILASKDVSDEERRDYLSEIQKSALRCKAIVESLMRFARQSPAAQKLPVLLNRAVEVGLLTVRQKGGAGEMMAEIVVGLAEKLSPISGDLLQLEQVVVNLITNALDAVKDVAGPRVEISTAVGDGFVLLEVADNGSGIADDVKARMFDPFFTTKEDGRGTGLGLAVTYAIVQEHGGRLSVRDRVGGGAVLTVQFPVAK